MLTTNLIPTKPPNILSRPLYPQFLILQRQIRLATVSKAKDIEPIVKSYDDNGFSGFNGVGDDSPRI